MKTIEAKNRKDAKNQMPEMAKIVKVCGGYAGFVTLTEYQVWRKAK